MSTNHNKVMDAFIKQTYGSMENAQTQDKIADKNPNAKPEHDDHFEDKGNQNLEKEADDKLKTQLGARILMNQPISDSMNIPSKLKENSLNQTTQTHPNFKNYDHSLEEHRGHKLGLIRLREAPTGSVAEMVGTMFDDTNLVE